MSELITAFETEQTFKPNKYKQKKMLVAEDCLPERTRLELILGKQQYKVKTATNGQEALNVIDNEKIDLTLTDWHMPRMSGLDLCKAVKEKRTVPTVHHIAYFSRCTLRFDLSI